ncbi:MAG: ABC transporter substrate-binding protein [Gammaproteobacteria bacterium]|nr:ABC transporter substrate-binding protein [Gammaproteobacteria bacterium]
MKKRLLSSLLFVLAVQPVFARQEIRALYIPLADHYPAIVAYEKYRDRMKEADFKIEQKKSWPALRGKFSSGRADMAFIISPMAMDMFAKKQNFRWISLIHRNGNALAINKSMEQYITLPPARIDRKPTADIAEAFVRAKEKLGTPTSSGVPSLFATHTVILYKFLKEHGKTLALGRGKKEDVIAIPVAPPASPKFLQTKDRKSHPASFEQSLPWADVVETGGYGKVAWYSKDVLQWPKGHVECIVIAGDKAINNKRKAVEEVIYYLHQAGMDIHNAREAGRAELVKIARLIRKHIPSHTEEAIVQSLDKQLDVIDYVDLNIDKGGLKQVMDLAVEAGVLKQAIDIERFGNDAFSTQITVHDPKAAAREQ